MLNTLSNIQIELLKLYSTDISESELLELKEQLSTFFANRAIKEANNIWEKNSLSNETMDEWLENA